MNGFEKQRLEAGLTQVEAARSLGVSQGTISTWENGLGFPTGAKIPAVAALYKCTIDQLYEGDTNEKPARVRAKLKAAVYRKKKGDE